MHFYKYQGTGNDFILLDNRDGRYEGLSAERVKAMCNRHFGIGADGLMLLNMAQGYDFGMTYFNSDGRQSSMCGNGGRCIAAFARHLGVIREGARFLAIDGPHEAVFSANGVVRLHMQDVNGIRVHETYFELDTGSPHYVTFTEALAGMDVKQEGALIRYSPVFKEHGINVNFVEPDAEGYLFVRTYERGVENETLSCGTGVTAAALVHLMDRSGPGEVPIRTLGGTLCVEANHHGKQQFTDVWLCGPAEYVFEGEWGQDSV